MDSTIKSLNPKEVWRHFAEICAIPHVSGNENRLREYIIATAKANKLAYRTDGAGNLLVTKPATKGRGTRKGVILQSHIDMVAQKEKEVEFDFQKDPVNAVIDSGWVRAEGTTLGADNGIGVAAMLAILESKEIEHGPLEALFTVGEEESHSGVYELPKDMLKGSILINLDLEEEGELCLGCSGGVELSASFKYIEDRNKYTERDAVRIEVRGLRGGHSGYDIDKGRANAVKILFRFLYLAMEYFDLHMNYIDAGGVLNAIPREATAVVSGPRKLTEDFLYGMEQFERIVRKEYEGVDDGISIKGYKCEVPSVAWDRKSFVQVLRSVCACQNGVVRMAPHMPGLVQTSTNLGRVVSGNGQILVQSHLRSSVETEREALVNDMSALFDLAGAKVRLNNAYDGWMYNLNSGIYNIMDSTYENLFGRKPRAIAVHASLETGIIGTKYPKLDMISCGPTIRGAHSPYEKVNIDSVFKFWELLKNTLANIPEN